MAEKTISHLIEVTKQENAESRGVTQEVASEVGALGKMFGKYFQELKNNAGDRQEEKREEKAPAAGGLPDLSTLMSDTKGMGIFGIIAGITAAIAGLAVGIVGQEIVITEAFITVLVGSDSAGDIEVFPDHAVPDGIHGVGMLS